MKILYFDCSMGAAGDMLMASLIDLVQDKEELMQELNALQIPQVEYRYEACEKSGVFGTHVRVLVHGEEEHEGMHEEHHDHHHSHLHDIEHIIEHLNADEKVKENAKAIYKMIAEAEGHVHQKDMEEIHFHEVGTMDAVADVVGVCYLMHRLNVERVFASPIHVGKGSVKCAHGVLPVPAPATAYLLKGVPIYSKDINGELCTPTGAALLKYFVDEFKDMPMLAIDQIGYGMGTKDFTELNCVRAIVGDGKEEVQEVVELDCNVDDMTGEEIGFAMDVILQHGANEVFTSPVYMKKNRPGTLITVLCGESKREEMISLLFQNTTTLGIRETRKKRNVLTREIQEVQTPYGTVRKKVSHGYGVKKEKVEFEDLASIAKKENTSLFEIKKGIKE